MERVEVTKNQMMVYVLFIELQQQGVKRGIVQRIADGMDMVHPDACQTLRALVRKGLLTHESYGVYKRTSLEPEPWTRKEKILYPYKPRPITARQKELLKVWKEMENPTLQKAGMKMRVSRQATKEMVSRLMQRGYMKIVVTDKEIV